MGTSVNDEKSSVTGFVIHLLNNFEEASFIYSRPFWYLSFLPAVLQKKILNIIMLHFYFLKYA